jgi:hypothetical protein
MTTYSRGKVGRKRASGRTPPMCKIYNPNVYIQLVQ